GCRGLPLLVVGGETPARAMLNNGGLRGEVWSSCWADGGGGGLLFYWRFRLPCKLCAPRNCTSCAAT
ncbi:hypothetical protein, partial [Kingella oralis]|uniref:hypothetical protein n=1 Tax=Kingella oralis TaxID=505 RepID=UPI0034E40207